MQSIQIDKIKDYVRSNQSNKRYLHTLGVADDTEKLCEIFNFDNERKHNLYCAALLHDVTKEMPESFHKFICEKYNFTPEYGGFSSPTIHAVSGAFLAFEKYPNVIGEKEKNAIFYHTTGKANMTVEEMIICLSDYMEPGRKYEGCKKIRQKFYSELNELNKIPLLKECLCESFDMTITSLISCGDYIDSNTFTARNCLICDLRKG